jgi:hypothetical protein
MGWLGWVGWLMHWRRAHYGYMATLFISLLLLHSAVISSWFWCCKVLGWGGYIVGMCIGDFGYISGQGRT